MRKKRVILFLFLVSVSLLLIIGVSSMFQPKEENNNEFIEPQPPIPSFSSDDVIVTGEERSKVVDIAVNDPEVKKWLGKGYEISAVYEITAYAGKGIYSVGILTQEQMLPCVVGITLKVNVDLGMEEVTNFTYDLELGSLSEEQKEEVMNIGVNYVEENYGSDYSINGDVEVGSGGTSTTFYAYPTASFRVPADYQQSGLIVNVMVDLETGNVTKVITIPSKNMPPSSPP
jgi:uncharacterized protein (UPF0254 family)